MITGFTAKESVVSTLTVLLGGDVSLPGTLFTPFYRICISCIYFALYAMRCGGCNCEAGNGRSKGGGWNGCGSVPDCMGGCTYCT